MTIPIFKTIGLPDGPTSRFQDNAAESFRNIEDKEILDGRILSGVSLISGSANNISHGLGRAAVGYIVIKRSADCRVWDEESTNTLNTAFLKLQTSANVTVDIWVF